MNIFSNPWFIGISGGILSGLIVTSITRFLFSRKDNREYSQKVITANQEILYAIRPGISEGIIPNKQILGALISATAIKYSVAKENLYTIDIFADTLIKEVMDSSFIAASQKEEFCKKLSQLRLTSDQPQKNIQTTVSTELSSYRSKMIALTSIMMGFMTATITLFLLLKDNDSITKLNHNITFEAFVPTVTAILLALTVNLASKTFYFKKKKIEEKNNSHSKKF